MVFIKLAEQGSTVLAVDAFKRAIRRVGRENVHVLVFEENRFIVDLLALIPPGNVVVIRTGSLWSLAISAVAALVRLRRAAIDACVDLEFLSNGSALLARASGARWRVGFHAGANARLGRGELFTHRVNYNPHLHTSRAFASLVLALEESAAALPTQAAVIECDAPDRFQPAETERDAVRAKLAAKQVPAGARLILLNANAGDLLPLRKWPAGNYVELARRLVRALPDAWIVFTGAPAEAAGVRKLVAELGAERCVSLAGETTLRELLVLYGLAEILVTNDSGPAHFAALTDLQVAVLFGPENPVRFAAENLRTHVFWAGIPCSPCINAFNQRRTSCRNNLCLQSITVDQVLVRVCQLFRSKTSALV
jgi:ADP-heptose:LPS heptosyltransferase